MKHWTRPDGRCFVFGEPDDDLPPGGLHAVADEDDESRLGALARLGFEVARRELVLRLPTDPARWKVPVPAPPPGVVFERADRVEEERLRLLDDVLRQDVPGTDGWRWDAKGFREETYQSPGFDPAIYRVAVDPDGSYIGIVRVWLRSEEPRLGFVGVRRDWRRQGLARALLASVLTVLHERDESAVRTEVDETNVPSRRLLEGFSGLSIGVSLELVRG